MTRVRNAPKISGSCQKISVNQCRWTPEQRRVLDSVIPLQTGNLQWHFSHIFLKLDICEQGSYGYAPGRLLFYQSITHLIFKVAGAAPSSVPSPPLVQLASCWIFFRWPYNLYCVGGDVKPCSISQWRWRYSFEYKCLLVSCNTNVLLELQSMRVHHARIVRYMVTSDEQWK